MKMRARWLYLCAFALLSATVGCGSDAPNACDPNYGGKATDEAWQVLLDAAPTAQVNPQAAMVTSPPEGEHVTMRPTITYTSPLSAALPTGRTKARLALVRTTSPGPNGRPDRWLDRALGGLLDLVIAPAFAHQPPISGPIYLISLTAQGLACPVYAITTELDWHVSEDSYAELKKVAGQPISLRIVSAYLRDNRITEGPFVAATPRTFYVHP